MRVKESQFNKDQPCPWKYHIPMGEYLGMLDEDSAMACEDGVRANTLIEFISQAAISVVDKNGGEVEYYEAHMGDDGVMFEVLCKAAGVDLNEALEELEKMGAGNKEQLKPCPNCKEPTEPNDFCTTFKMPKTNEPICVGCGESWDAHYNFDDPHGKGWGP